MAALQFANFALSTLAGPITNTSTTANLAAGTGALFPVLTTGEFFKLVFTDAATGLNHEIVNVTAISGDTITIVRGQEGTTAQNWLAGDAADNFLTAASMAGFAQTGSLPSTYLAGTDTGTSANALSVTSTTPASTSVTAATLYLLTKNNQTNTGAVTAQVPGSATNYTVVYGDGGSLNPGDYPAGATAWCYFTGGVFQFLGVARSLNAPGIYRGALTGTNTTTSTFTPILPAFSGAADGTIFVLTPSAANTGSVTVNGVPLYYVDGASTMLPGELQANQPIVTVKFTIGGNAVLLLRSPTNPLRSATLTSSNSTSLAIAESTFTAYPLGTASSAFCSISGTSVTILQPGIYVVSGTLNITQSNGTAGSNYNWEATLTKNGTVVPGGFAQVGNFGQGTQTANLSPGATFSAVAGDVLNLNGEADCTTYLSGSINSGSISVTKLI